MKLIITLFTILLIGSCGGETENTYKYPTKEQLPSEPIWIDFKFTPQIMINLPGYPQKNKYSQMTEFAYKKDQFYSAGFLHSPINPEIGHASYLEGRYSKYPSKILFHKEKEINGIKGTEIIYEFEPYDIQGHQMPEIRHEFIYNHKGFTMLLCSWYSKKDEMQGKLNATRFINSVQLTH